MAEKFITENQRKDAFAQLAANWITKETRKLTYLENESRNVKQRLAVCYQRLADQGRKDVAEAIPGGCRKIPDGLNERGLEHLNSILDNEILPIEYRL